MDAKTRKEIHGTIECGRCDGDGWVFGTPDSSHPGVTKIDCPECHGKGHHFQCFRCDQKSGGPHTHGIGVDPSDDEYPLRHACDEHSATFDEIRQADTK